VEFGAPVYSYGRALAAPQYMPDDGLVNALQEYVKKRGGKEFFKSSHWRDELFNTSRDYIKHSYLTERYEDQQEYEERIRRELTLSKEIIERNLCKKVSFLCWPGGAFNQTTQRIAQETGYLATTKGSSRNTWGADPRRINRIGGHVALTKKHPLVDRYANLLMFAATVESYRGNPLYSGLLRLSLRTVHISRWLLGPRGGR
jgi:uncharacterized C2H2 Zn-finger protein